MRKGRKRRERKEGRKREVKKSPPIPSPASLVTKN